MNYTSQFFKRQLGVSFLEYLLRLRLREATVRLANSEEAIVRIANRCGFPDIKAFNVAFKKHFHTTPSEYRKQARSIGRKTKLHNWKEMISTRDKDMLDILNSFLPYHFNLIDGGETSIEADKKLQSLKAKLKAIVEEL